MSMDDDDDDEHLSWSRFYSMIRTLAANLHLIHRKSHFFFQYEKAKL